jgi:hypothetical protein
VTAALFGSDTKVITPVSSTTTLDVYTVSISTDPNSFILKVRNAPGASSSWIKVEVVNFYGIVGIYETDSGSVDSFSIKSRNGNYLKTMIYGTGFSADLKNEKMDAQVPPDARDSMRAAAAEEPTKNRVFDINIMFEQLASQYNNFKNNIRSKIYEMLSYTINYGTGTYTERKLANTVWNLIESYGFGSVERIINWYDTEERKELMANIVLNNEGYAEKLGYGSESGSMDYLFAARLAVLTFVDWVDREYVENSWISSLAAAFGVNIRLADLVNQVFDISGFVLSSIRDELNKAWEGVKQAGNFIMDIAFKAILDTVAISTNSLLSGIFHIIKTMSDTISSISINQFVEVESNNQNTEYGLNREDNFLTLKMGEEFLDIILGFGSEISLFAGGAELTSDPLTNIFKEIKEYIDEIAIIYNLAGKYILMELLKDFVITLSFAIIQSLILVGRVADAYALFISLLSFSIGLSVSIFYTLKNDNDLALEEKLFVNQMLSAFHLDNAFGVGVDSLLNLIPAKNKVMVVMATSIATVATYTPQYQDGIVSFYDKLSGGLYYYMSEDRVHPIKFQAMLTLFDVAFMLIAVLKSEVLFSQNLMAVGGLLKILNLFQNFQFGGLSINLNDIISDISRNRNDYKDDKLGNIKIHLFGMATLLSVYHIGLSSMFAYAAQLIVQ